MFFDISVASIASVLAHAFRCVFFSIPMDNRRKRKALALYHLALRRQKLLLLLLLHQEKGRNSASPLFQTRATEGAFHILVNRHLAEDDRKFQEYFRLTKEEFDYVLSLIEEDLRTKPSNRVRNPITPREKLAVTLR